MEKVENKLLDGLNKNQKEAVIHDKGPLLIVAGAGTGKTTVITRRIAWLIAGKYATPSEILALTFTDKAAAEMEERVDELVPYGFVDTWISTFHAFGDRILRDHALDLGLTSDFRVLSRAEQTIFMQDNLSAFDLKYFAPLGNPTKHIDALLTHFSRLKDEIISPSEYLLFAEKKLKSAQGSEESREAEKTLEIARCYERYQDLMAESGNLDFGDQIVSVINLFQDNPAVLAKYQDQFRFILVDEFQDTNYAQNRLVNMLAKKNQNITVVGDDDQSIYRFRGAAVSNILEFGSSYPGCKQIVLTENYRSNQAILDCSYKLIKHNDPDRLEVKNNINKKLVSRSGASPVQPVHIHCDTVTAEADQVAKLIKEKFEEGECTFKDIAILVRSNSTAASYIHALNHYGIPFKFSGLAGLYDRPEVRLIIQFAKALVNPGDDLAFYHLLISDIYKVEVAEAVKLNAQVYKSRRNLSQIAQQNISEIDEKTAQLIATVIADLKKFREQSKDMTAGQVIYAFLKETGYLTKLIERAEKDTESQIKIQNIAKFFEKISEFEKISDDKSILNFVNHLTALISAGEDPATAEIDPDLDAVSILTIHKAKGLEYKTVFMVALTAGNFPSVCRSEALPIPEELIKESLPVGDWHIQEERRLFYVGLTRAKETLYLTSAEDYGGKRAKKVSPFVMEALDSPRAKAEKVKIDGVEIIKRFEKSQTKAVPKKFFAGGQLVLNPHQIDDYLSCPKKFEYIHVLRVPIMTHHSVVYGSAIHRAIEEYFVRKKAGRKVSLEDIYEVFDHNWRSEGFLTRQHEDLRYKQGRKSLAEFYSREEELNSLPAEVECKFEFEIEELNVKIRGRFDAVYKRAERLEIRDFKTSEVDDQKKASEKARSNRQIAIYALAKWYEEKKIPIVSLYFVDSGLIGEVEKKEKDLAKTKEDIKRVVDGVKAENFTANPGYRECSRCAFREICPFTLTN